ncbi:putative lipoprotein precursor [Candidatus Rhodobacter oscarellae]|uniref:Putative lipoprotein n=1 Tax=Candidatus Rhodobacter oscarellae TaxID=1675527 RepID=A0A0J9EC39_9RHOB|nr:DUF3833 domain-containing protein [Candidatus Rhodobacter lobularis]KMW60191.1 putative lipoprotein precursor [Candidatus Rhodobacter lobularis]
MDVLIFMLAGAVLALFGVLVWTRRMGFLAQSPEDYSGQGPAFDLKRHLSGPILCEGVIYGPTGRVASRFVADMEGTWDGDSGTLTEHFRYDSGRAQDRFWSLTLGRDGMITAEAPDVVGQGTGVQSGAGVRLSYKIQLPQDAGGHVLDVTDWMYLMENGTIINRSQFRKFGIKVAELVATMRPVVGDEKVMAAE